MEISSFQHYLIGLLAIGNNISALGAFLLHTRGMPRTKVRRLILMSSSACLITLMLFMLLGTWILDFFGISVSAFQIAGGLLLGGLRRGRAVTGPSPASDRPAAQPGTPRAARDPT